MIQPAAILPVTIPTKYNGFEFRSRLEARWALFYDRLGIRWEYELEGYDLGKLWYVPDFWLPQQKCWIEIKPESPSEEAEEKASRLARATGHPVYLFHGPVTVPDPVYWREDESKSWAYAFFPDGGGDQPYYWCECSTCGSLGLQYDGRSDRLPCKERCLRSLHGDKGYNLDSPRLLAAFEAARRHRFW